MQKKIIPLFLAVFGVDVFAGDLPSCPSALDGAFYVKWHDNLLKVWPGEVDVVPDVGGAAEHKRNLGCEDNPYLRYRWTTVPTLWEYSSPGVLAFRLWNIEFYNVKVSQRMELQTTLGADLRILADLCRSEDEADHELGNWKARVCSPKRSSFKRYVFSNYTVNGSPFTLVCEVEDSKGTESCRAGYRVRDNLVVEYKFFTDTLAINDVVSVDQALNRQFDRRISRLLRP